MTVIGAVVLMIGGFIVLDVGREIWTNPDPVEVADSPNKVTAKTVTERGGTQQRRTRTTTKDASVESPTQADERSETLVIALIATGAGLLLAGGYAARLTSLKLPGVELSAATLSYVKETTAAATAAAVEQKPELAQDPKKLAAAGALVAEKHLAQLAIDTGSVAALAAATSRTVAPTAAPAPEDLAGPANEAIRELDS